MSEKHILKQKTESLRPNVSLGSSGRTNSIAQGKVEQRRRRSIKAVGCSSCSRRSKRQGKK